MNKKNKDEQAILLCMERIERLLEVMEKREEDIEFKDFFSGTRH